MSESRNALLLAVAVILAGCPDSHDASDAGGVLPDGMAPDGSSDAHPDVGPIDSGPMAAECAAVCALRDESASSGFCELDWMTDAGPCVDICGALGGASVATWDALEECVTSDPLCFRSLEDCIYGTRHPVPVPVQAVLRGTGFEAQEGREVEARLSVGADLVPVRTRIAGGGFEVVWSEELRPAEAPTTMLYIDLDADGACDAETDITALVRLERAGTIDEPSFVGVVDGPPEGSSTFVCTSR